MSLNDAKLFGLPLYLVVGLHERVQVRFPRSKKKRIRLKWAKNKPRNFELIEVYDYRIVHGAIYMHPDYYQHVRCALSLPTPSPLTPIPNPFPQR